MSTSDGVVMCRTIKMDGEQRSATEEMIKNIPNTVVDVLDSRDEDEE